MSNSTIFPASLLPLADQFGRLANSLPDGTCLLILPPKPSPTWDALFGLAAAVEQRGLPVDLLDADEVLVTLGR